MGLFSFESIKNAFFGESAGWSGPGVKDGDHRITDAEVGTAVTALERQLDGPGNICNDPDKLGWEDYDKYRCLSYETVAGKKLTPHSKRVKITLEETAIPPIRLFSANPPTKREIEVDITWQPDGPHDTGFVRVTWPERGDKLPTVPPAEQPAKAPSWSEVKAEYAKTGAKLAEYAGQVADRAISAVASTEKYDREFRSHVTASAEKFVSKHLPESWVSWGNRVSSWLFSDGNEPQQVDMIETDRDPIV